MADSKGNEPKPADPKAGDTKSGPVKPPVLDLKARPAGGETAKPEAVTAEAAARPKPAEKPPAPAAVPAPGFAYGSAVLGGVLGLAAAYGLAFFGLWPTTPAAPPAADPRLANFATAIPELETVTQTTQSELAALNQRVGALESAEPAAATASAGAAVDLSAVEADIAALATRIDDLAATPAPEADTGALDSLRTDFAALGTRLDELAARVGTAEAGLRTLDTTVTETSATLADQPSDIGAVLQLPLILSGFETAFATGRPYETELAALRAAAPEADIPTAIANAATSGLARPDAIARRFEAVLPAMLAGRPAKPDAQWQDGALDWFASVIALRPTGEIEGDTPEAVMSRLVGAVERRDFTSAETLLASLPEPMQAAAEDVPDLIASQAEAAHFLETLRTQALSGEAAQ
jgi:hypothetical protein